MSVFSAAVFVAVSLPLSIFDIRSYRVPDFIVLPGLALGMIASSISGAPTLVLLAEMAVIGGLFLLVKYLTDGKMGVGDVKYALFVCACVGGMRTLLSVFVATILGLFTYGVFALIRGKQGLDRPLPFVPYIAGGVACITLIEFFEIYSPPTLW